MASEQGTFAGLWIRHEPEFGAVARFTRDGDQTIRPYLAGSPLEGLVEVLPASANFAQLEAVQNKVRFLVDGLGIPAESGVDIQNNHAYVSVTDRVRLAAALQRAKVSLPQETTVEQVDELMVTTEDIYGGVKLVPPAAPAAYCTSGFSVVHSSGTTGMTTAGHCRDNMTFRGAGLTHIADRFSGPYDLQWHTTPFVDRPWVRDNLDVRTITAGRGRLGQPEGSTVCGFGQGGAEPEFTCGTIIDRSYRPQSASYNNPTSTFVLVGNNNADISDAGDSGGPWYTGSTALGITSGGNLGSRVFYMSITYFNDDGPVDFNLTVRKG